MKETRVPTAQSANLAANSGNTIYGVGVITAVLHYAIDMLAPLPVKWPWVIWENKSHNSVKNNKL